MDSLLKTSRLLCSVLRLQQLKEAVRYSPSQSFIEEGRAASKIPYLYVSVSSFSADIIPNSAVGIFPQKQKEQRNKQLGYTDKFVTAQI
jgi:hypothetical protein